MDLPDMYYECPICKELLDDDIEFAHHLILRHRPELRRKDGRLKKVSESIKEEVIKMLIKEAKGLII